MKDLNCDMCGDINDSVGFLGCDHPGHASIKICKQCDIDGQDYNGWCDGGSGLSLSLIFGEDHELLEKEGSDA